ncbi:hypothetical protein SDC9_183974 [bioreactor metagenome]|uniref:DUF3502 domain-containing protein n=1 Tax=bioreactor metagenome TaxID=1076179 RepID=A0A645HBR6_9ZZZZ
MEVHAFNESAPWQSTLGFAFDDSAVAAENKALNALRSRYAYGLETGQLSPDVYLDRMLQEMSQAGEERVRAEMQAQFDLWMKEKAP